MCLQIPDVSLHAKEETAGYMEQNTQQSERCASKTSAFIIFYEQTPCAYCVPALWDMPSHHTLHHHPISCLAAPENKTLKK